MKSDPCAKDKQTGLLYGCLALALAIGITFYTFVRQIPPITKNIAWEMPAGITGITLIIIGGVYLKVRKRKFTEKASLS